MFGWEHKFGVQRSVPIDWTVNTCLIHLETQDQNKVANLSLAEGYAAVEQIIDQCIVQQPAGYQQGGYVLLGADQEFYIMVQANPGDAYLSLTYSLNHFILPRLAVKGGMGGDAAAGMQQHGLGTFGVGNTATARRARNK